MKKRLPIKGWQWDERLRAMLKKDEYGIIPLFSNAERVAFKRSAERLRLKVGTGRPYDQHLCGWIISKKGGKK